MKGMESEEAQMIKVIFKNDVDRKRCKS